MEIDIKQLEKIMKVCQKHNISEFVCPDGTILRFAPKLATEPKFVKPRAKTLSPINDPTANVDVRFAAVLPAIQKNDFQRFGVSRLLQTPVSEEDN